METTAMDTTAKEATRDVFEELARSLQRLNLLMDACDAWLRDVNDPARYDIGPRASEVLITCAVQDDAGKMRRIREPLDALLHRIEPHFHIDKTDARTADPRTLLLRSAQEIRQTVAGASALARMLADARSMEQLRETLLAEIAKADEPTARRIAEAVRNGLVRSGVAPGREPTPETDG